MNEILKASGVRRSQVLLAVAAGSITLLAALGLTVLSGWLITRAWQMPPILDLGIAITAVRGLGISRAVFRYIDRLVSHQLALKALSTLQVKIFRHLLGAEFRRHADTINVINSDAQRITELIVRTIVPRGVAMTLSVIAVLGAAFLQPIAALILAIGFAISGILVPRIFASTALKAKSAETSDEFRAHVGIYLRDIATLEVEGTTSGYEQDLALQARGISRSVLREDRPMAVAESIRTISQLSVAFAFVGLGYVFYDGSPTWLGMLVLLPLAAFESHGPLPGAALHSLAAQPSIMRVQQVLDCPEIPSSTTKGPIDISAKDVLPRYGERRFNVEAPFGSRIVLRGPSGCGKTTFLATLAGHIEPSEGTISPADRAGSIHFHPEDEWIFATSIRENLLIANPSATDDLLFETLEAVGLGEWVAHNSLDLVLHDGHNSLSSGQRRRLLLARALVSTAPVLLLDEPTEHLSNADAQRILNMLQYDELPGALAQRTVIIVTHQPEI